MKLDWDRWLLVSLIVFAAVAVVLNCLDTPKGEVGKKITTINEQARELCPKGIVHLEIDGSIKKIICKE